ncbi:MAG: hypothetical protein HY240_07860 [Actinobacteria bacterium]|nr:hypothetical protein [Actinomycetota bacterium]
MLQERSLGIDEGVPGLKISESLTEVVSKAGVPYGYTLTIWTTGALCLGRFGLPSQAEVFLFVAGGTLAYVGLALLVTRGRTIRAARPPAALWENAFAVPAVGGTWAIDRLMVGAGWNFFLSPLLATTVYLLASRGCCCGSATSQFSETRSRRWQLLQSSSRSIAKSRMEAGRGKQRARHRSIWPTRSARRRWPRRD